MIASVLRAATHDEGWRRTKDDRIQERCTRGDVRMKAAFISGARAFAVKDIDAPAPGAGEALVRVRNCGVCGSDLHFYRGEFPSVAGLCPGHEIAGEIEDVGDGVDGFAKGDRVAVEPLVVCLTCARCRAGNYQLCRSRKLVGTYDAPGALREYMVVPAYGLYRLPDELDFELGALVEPLAVAVHGLKLAGLQYGERVAVLGAGTIGLLSAAAAKAMGASQVATSARHAHQKAMAEAVGADIVYDATTEGATRMARELRGPDVVVETVGGHADTLDQAMGLVGFGGRVSVLGVFTKPVRVNPTGFVLKEGRLVGSMTYGRSGAKSDFDIAIEIMRRERERLRPLITHRFALEDVAEAFATADDKTSGSIKVTVEL